MNQHLSVIFYPKKPKGYTAGPVHIYMRLTVRQEGAVKSDVTEMSTGKKVDVQKWSSAANRLSGKTDEVKTLNEYFDLLELKASNAQNQLLRLGQPITAEKIKLMIEGKPLEKERTIMSVFKEHNENMCKLIGKDYTESTWERYETSYRHTVAFMTEAYRVDDLPIGVLNLDFIEKYALWLKTVRHCDHNTTIKYLANFKKIVLICVKKKWLPGDPFAEFKMGKRKKRRIPLTQAEVDAMTNKHFESDRLRIVRDTFIFSCYTGLAYADIKKLRKEDFFVGIDGFTWMRVGRKKGERHDASSNIPLLPMAENILRRYEKDAYCLTHGVALPVRSNQKTNEYLREIADLCGIAKKMTFHLARHTFATTITLANKVPIETVSKLLAHSTITMTQQYAQVTDEKISIEMQALRIKLTR